MKAIVFNKAGAPEAVLEIVEQSKPVPGDGEVLVKTLACPVNPSDVYFIQGAYRIKPVFPAQTAGLEGAGIVAAVGSGADVAVGSLVAFFYTASWAEYVVVPAAELTVLPDAFPVEKAAQFSLNPFTAWGLLDAAQPVAGEWMLLTGANSSVSRIVIQLARQRGVCIIALVRDLAQATGLRALGADEVIDMEDAGFSGRVQELTGGKGFNVALDVVGGYTGTTIFELIAPFGRVVLYGAIDKDPVQFHYAQMVYKNLTVKGFGIRAYLNGLRPEQRVLMIKELVETMGTAAFELPVERIFPYTAFGEAMRENGRNGRSGKILLKFF